MTKSFGTSGFRELDLAFDRLGGTLSDADKKAAAAAGLDVIIEEAKRLVHSQTGKLAGSLVIVNDSGNLPAMPGTVYGGPALPAGWYAGLVEDGTRRSAAHPFMRPAVDMRSDEAVDVVADRLRQNLVEAAR